MADVRLDLSGPLNKVRPRLFDGVVARTHSVEDPLSYASGPEHRDAAGLASIVGQLAGLPVVAAAEPDTEHPLGHPDNLLLFGVEYYEIGRVISGKVDGDKAVASIYIHDPGALREIEDGTRELSLGYRCSLDDNRTQTSIILDHLSVVPRARCGSVCALRTDALGAEAPKSCGCLAKSMPGATNASVNVAEMEVALKIVLDENSKEVLSALSILGNTNLAPAPEAPAKCACNSHAIVHNTEIPMTAEEIKKLDDALAAVVALQTEVTTLKTAAAKTDEAAALALNQVTADLKAEKLAAEKLAADLEAAKADAKTKIDAAAQARTDAEETAFAARVDARVELLADATKVGVESFKLDGDKKVALSDREIKVAIVKKVDEMDIEDTRSIDYVNGMYAGAMKRHAKADASVAEVRETLAANHDAAVVDVGKDIKTIEAELRAAEDAKRANKWRK